MPILSKEELLQKQVENSIAQKVAQKERFTNATEEFKKTLIECCDAALAKAEGFPSYYEYVSLDTSMLKKQFQGYSYTTLLYGFWDRETRCFKDTVFEENEVEKPFDKVAEDLKQKGYTLCNESIPEKKNSLILRIYWN